MATAWFNKERMRGIFPSKRDAIYFLQRLGNRLIGRQLHSRTMDYSSYIALQLRKTTDPARREKWLGAEWEAKITVFTATFRRVFDYLPLKPKKALMIGARTGQEVVAAQALGVDAIGVDLVSAPPYVIEGDMHALPFHDGEFDFVFSNAFDHALFPDTMVREAERVCRPGGHILLQIQLNKPDDQFGVTDVYQHSAVLSLFQRSSTICSGPLAKRALSMNYEILVRRN